MAVQPKEIPNIEIIVGNQRFTYTKNSQNVKLCVNKQPHTFKQWKAELEKAGITLTYEVAEGIESAYEISTQQIFQEHNTCS